MLEGKNILFFTTNVDHCFQQTGRLPKRTAALFYTQGTTGCESSLLGRTLSAPGNPYDNCTKAIETSGNGGPTAAGPGRCQAGALLLHLYAAADTNPMAMNLPPVTPLIFQDAVEAGTETTKQYDQFVASSTGRDSHMYLGTLGVGFNTRVLSVSLSGG